MTNTNSTTSVETIKAKPFNYVFCTIPKWANSATVDERGNVIRWHR